MFPHPHWWRLILPGGEKHLNQRHHLPRRRSYLPWERRGTHKWRDQPRRAPLESSRWQHRARLLATGLKRTWEQRWFPQVSAMGNQKIIAAPAAAAPVLEERRHRPGHRRPFARKHTVVVNPRSLRQTATSDSYVVG
jgi:hypothetical protein